MCVIYFFVCDKDLHKFFSSLGDGKIATLAEETNGPHFAIREKGVGPTTHMSTFVKLINALMTIQTYFTKDVSTTWPVMVRFFYNFFNLITSNEGIMVLLVIKFLKVAHILDLKDEILHKRVHG